MGVVARILCKSPQDNYDFQLTAKNIGIQWGMGIEMPWNTDRMYLMITEPQPDQFFLTWAILEDFARENVPLARASDFAWDPNVWPRLLKAYRTRQLEAIAAKQPSTAKVEPPSTNVIMPEEFVATKYPGYFWNVKTKQLFTAKLGVLRQLKVSLPNRWNRLNGPAYRISHEGVRRTMTVAQLSKLAPKASVFPVEFVTTKSNTNDDVAVNLSRLPAGTTVKVRIEG